MNKNFKIRKGSHYSLHLPKFQYNLQELNFIVNFDSNCEYILGNQHQLDINKLYGISFGNHMKNSVRIGWNYNPNRKVIELWAFLHQNSKMSWEYLGDTIVEKNTKFNIQFRRNINTIVINWGENNKEIINFNFPEAKYGYYLFPYFGGTQVSPNTMNIKIEQL